MQIAAHLSGIAENSALLMKCNRITANNERVAPFELPAAVGRKYAESYRESETF